MNSHHVLLVIPLLGATIWVGGHLYLCIRLLPRVVRERNVSMLLSFERDFEPVGMGALAALVISGIWMTLQFGIDMHQWFTFSSPLERVTSTKLILLLTTVAFALSAQIRVIPKLEADPEKLPEMAFHILSVTLIGVALLIIGSLVRYGGI